MTDTTEPQRSADARFREGDLVLLIDRKRRRYLQRLTALGIFQTHLGRVPHTEIIGQEVGSRVFVGGHRYLALRPTLAEYTLESKRLTQIVYPKDIGAILVAADIFPGARVLEAGLGSHADGFSVSARERAGSVHATASGRYPLLIPWVRRLAVEVEASSQVRSEGFRGGP